MRLSWSASGFAHAKRNPPPKQRRVKDPQGHPLFVICNPSGKLTFQFLKTFRRRQHQQVIGEWPSTEIEDARTQASTLLAELRTRGTLRNEPISEASKWTVRQALDRYLQEKDRTLIEATKRTYRAELSRFGWDDVVVADIRKPAILSRAAELSKSETPYSIQRTLDRLNTVIRFVNENLDDDEPLIRTSGIRRAKAKDYAQHVEGETHPIRSDADWATAWALAMSLRETQPLVATHWLLCAATGLRPWTEVATLHWLDVYDLYDDVPYLLIPGDRMKTKGIRRARARLPRQFKKYLSPAAAEALRFWKDHRHQERYSGRPADFVFPSRRAAASKPHIIAAAGLLQKMRLAVGDSQLVHYSLKKFYVNAAPQAIPEKVRLALTDHSRKGLNIHDSTYGVVSDQDLYDAEMEVGVILSDIAACA